MNCRIGISGPKTSAACARRCSTGSRLGEPLPQNSMAAFAHPARKLKAYATIRKITRTLRMADRWISTSQTNVFGVLWNSFDVSYSIFRLFYDFGELATCEMRDCYGNIRCEFSAIPLMQITKSMALFSFIPPEVIYKR